MLEIRISCSVLVDSYQIKLDLFEGPLDLLLHLVRKDEIEISQVSIVRITDQYLACLDAYQELNLEIAGEFVVMAATLMDLKSRELLPQYETVESIEDGMDGESWLDSKEELISQLLEYRQFKEAAQSLKEREWIQSTKIKVSPAALPERENQDRDSGRSSELESSTVDVLLRSLCRMLERLDAQDDALESGWDPFEEFEEDRSWNVLGQADWFLASLPMGEKLDFCELMESMFAQDWRGARPRMVMVLSFVALLELVRLGWVELRQQDADGILLIERLREGFPENWDDFLNRPA